MNLIETIKNFFDDFDFEIQSDELAPKDYDERVFFLYNESEPK